jgi:hypothetical protein
MPLAVDFDDRAALSVLWCFESRSVDDEAGEADEVALRDVTEVGVIAM